ncbi:MAG: hypothetical protein GY841_14745 [FCB group bacterium]|nr:hypothetical protein [FCB group bacterium]
MRNVFWLTPLIMIALFTNAFSVNQNVRKGGVVGIGYGYATVLNWNWNNGEVLTKGNGFPVHCFFGHNWDGINTVALSFQFTPFRTDQVPFTNGIKYNVYQYFVGLMWLHYFSKSNRGLFTTLAFGQCDYFLTNAEDDFNFEYDTSQISPHRMWAIDIGGGYQISKWFQVGVYFGIGRTSAFSGSNQSSSHKNLSFMLTAPLKTN